MLNISVIILARNEELHIRRCLENILPIAREVFVIDCFSTDNTAANNSELIGNISLDSGTPVIAGEEGICKGCGVATLTISYYDIGYKTGEMAYEILVNGANPAEMPIEYAPQFTAKYNPTMCEALGLTAPDGYEAVTE